MDVYRQSPQDSCRGNAPVAVLSGANEPWFVLKDVCAVLGLRVDAAKSRLDQQDHSTNGVLGINNPRQVKPRLNSDDVNTIVLTEGKGNPNKKGVSTQRGTPPFLALSCTHQRWCSGLIVLEQPRFPSELLQPLPVG